MRRQARGAAAHHLDLRRLEARVAHQPSEQPVPQRAVTAAGRARCRAPRTRAPTSRRRRARWSGRRPARRWRARASSRPAASCASGGPRARRASGARRRGRWRPASAAARPPTTARSGASSGADTPLGGPLGLEGRRVGARRARASRRARRASTSASGVPAYPPATNEFWPPTITRPPPLRTYLRMFSRYFSSP